MRIVVTGGSGKGGSWVVSDLRDAVFPSYWDDPHLRSWNLWGYVDARDVATAARLALEAPIEGAEIAIIAAADTVMTRPSADLMAEVFPGVPLRRHVEGRETLLAIDHARRLLGYEPSHRWADHVSGPDHDGGRA